MVGYDFDELRRYDHRGGSGASDQRRLLAIVAGAAAIVLVIVGAAVFFLTRGDDGDSPNATAEAYLAAWQEEDTETMVGMVGDPPESFAEEHESFQQVLGIEEASYSLDEVETDGDDAVARFDATLTLAGLGEWSYQGRLRLRRTGEDDSWQVAWTAAGLHPAQQEGMRLGLTSEWPERGEITGTDGGPLVTELPAIQVGIVPERMDDREEVQDALEEHLDVDPDSVDQALDASWVQPDSLVPIVTIPRPQYETVRPDIYPVPGLVFPKTTMRMGQTEEFAAHVLGRTGEITAERLEELGPPYQAGDVVGMTGLEATFEQELAGTPSGEIQLLDDEGEVVEVVDTIEGNEPVDVETTIDPLVQQAVDEALAEVEKPAAAVVVDRDGNIRATASRPLDEYNRAFSGSYPPGSTFKVVTTDALLTNGMTPDTEIDCEETIAAGGREFKNFEGGELGSVRFRKAFAESCNTAFISAAGDLEGSDMVAAAERFGFNTEYSVGMETAGGTFPLPESETEKAAAAIGQGKILASPLHMATVAAAILDGGWQPPVLLPDPPSAPSEGEGDQGEAEAEAEDETSEDSSAPPEVQPLDPTHQATLTELMGLVVREGSGTDAAVPDAQVAGKTGTAEFGTGDPPPTHAWFIGFRDDLALAIVIEDGGVGGRDAAPIAGDIFARL